MKNKRLIVILSIFACITLFIVLGSAVFTVSKVELKWLTTTNIYTGVNGDEIIESGEFNYRESIFLVSKDKYVKKLESENPYLKVVDIVTEFPNKLVVNVAERAELYALRVTDSQNTNQNSYVILDKELKILSIRNSFGGADTEPILLQTNLSASDTDFTVGSFANNLLVNNAMGGIGQAFEGLGFTVPGAKKDFQNITLNLNSNRSEVTIKTRWGITIIIEDATVRLFDKMHKAVSLYIQMREDGESRGYLKAYIHENVVNIVHSLTGDFS